jgi:hypothetical protein
MKTLIMFLLLLSQFAIANDDLTCGPPPGMISKLFTDAEKIHLKCLEDADKRNRERVLKEVYELKAVSDKLETEIKATAISYTISTVQCEPRHGEKRDPKLVKRCKDAVVAQRGVIDRMDTLMGWKTQYVEKPVKNPVTSKPKESADYPCPSNQELDKMKVARVFNKRLNEMWTRCMVDNQL